METRAARAPRARPAKPRKRPKRKPPRPAPAVSPFAGVGLGRSVQKRSRRDLAAAGRRAGRTGASSSRFCCTSNYSEQRFMICKIYLNPKSQSGRMNPQAAAPLPVAERSVGDGTRSSPRGVMLAVSPPRCPRGTAQARCPCRVPECSTSGNSVENELDASNPDR